MIMRNGRCIFSDGWSGNYTHQLRMVAGFSLAHQCSTNARNRGNGMKNLVRGRGNKGDFFGKSLGLFVKGEIPGETEAITTYETIE